MRIYLSTLLSIFAVLFGPIDGAFAQSEAGKYDLFTQRIKPILDQRCIQCHSCYNAPCQLNFTSVDGLNRGLVKNFEVHTKRLRADEPSRLGIDRRSTEEWRFFSSKHQFYPVTESTYDAKKNLESSFIYQLTQHKRKNADLPLNDVNDKTKEQAEISRTCPVTTVELREHMDKRPNAGMPYGLPPLSDEELRAVEEWTKRGSPRAAPILVAPAEDRGVKHKAEVFLNRYISNSDSEEARKESLVSRYIYEHLFLALIALNDRPGPEVLYRLIRAKSPCDAGDLEELPTRRPWDDPGDKFYYCFKRIDQTVMHKNYLRYPIDEKRVDRWNDLFFTPKWKVSYSSTSGLKEFLFGGSKLWPADVAPRDDRSGHNPLLVFRDIPVKARYQFLLDDADYIVDTFIRGPVCKGSTALNSIDEQFYVFFVKPESDLMVKNERFHQQAIPLHLMPASDGSDSLSVTGLKSGRGIRQAREQYRALRDQYMGVEFPNGYSVSDIWDGYGEWDRRYQSTPNKVAALTIFRNYDSASVVHGLVGATPKSIGLVDYSVLERLVYNLVTGFDIYGDVSHYVLTRIYMAYLRMEFEENFLSLLPGNVRVAMRKSWYIPSQGTTERIGNVINSVLMRDKDKISRRYPLHGVNRPTSLPLAPLNEDEFYGLDGTAQEVILRSYRQKTVALLKQRVGPALTDVGRLNPDKPFTMGARDVRIGSINSLTDFERELAKLTDLRGLNTPWVMFIPDVSLVVVDTESGSEIYSFLRNKEHFNIAWIAGEVGRRNRNADSLVVYRGVGGSYPNHIFRIGLAQAKDFLQRMNDIHDHKSYEGWLRDFGNPRSGSGSERFWANSDHVHKVFRARYPKEYGALDYNRYGVDYRSHKDGETVDPLIKDISDKLRSVIGRFLNDEEE